MYGIDEFSCANISLYFIFRKFLAIANQNIMQTETTLCKKYIKWILTRFTSHNKNKIERQNLLI